MAERIRPEQPKVWFVLVEGGKVQGVLVDKVRVVLIAQAERKRVFQLFHQILLGGQRHRSQIVVGWLLNETKLVVIERVDAGLVLGIGRNVATVGKVLPQERTRFQLANLPRVAHIVRERVIVSGQDRHQVRVRVVVDLVIPLQLEPARIVQMLGRVRHRSDQVQPGYAVDADHEHAQRALFVALPEAIQPLLHGRLLPDERVHVGVHRLARFGLLRDATLTADHNPVGNVRR
uniref:(northern house mosquito) hypothetical protein n=1 Tax=Culex pipiens TaxID=7175 RepID=A0A8D8F455_CULPI